MMVGVQRDVVDCDMDTDKMDKGQGIHRARVRIEYHKQRLVWH